MKKIIRLTLISLIITCIMGNVYAAISCNMELQTQKKEFDKNEEFTVEVKTTNLQSDRGIISMGATLEYDKDSLELIKMEGQNGWETPINGASYNEANGKMVLTRNGLGTNAETIFKITFKVKEESKQNLMITLKNITVADGYSPAKIDSVYENITVKGGKKNPVPTPDTNNSSATKDPNANEDNTKKGLLPKAGAKTFFWIVLIIGTILLILAIRFYIKMKKIK